MIFALEKFRSYLIGSKVVVFTDHAALKYLLTKRGFKTPIAEMDLALARVRFGN